MGLCTVADVQAYAKSKTLEDSVYTNLINNISLEIASEAGYGATDSTVNNNLKLACVHRTAAAVIRQMKITGEQAASVKRENASQNNDPDKDIEDHEAKSKRFIFLYKKECGGVTIPYGRAGPGTVNADNY
jgi:hypothetical protein